MKYTLETLSKINQIFCCSHILSEYDVQMANDYVHLIENTRNTVEPKAGDIVEFTDEYGTYYENAHIQSINEDEVYICEKPYVPFVYTSNNKKEIVYITSGGAWTYIPKSKLKFLYKKLKTFCNWGNCGVCAHGAVEFEAQVDVWEYKEKNNYISSLYNKEYSTKEFNRMFINYELSRNDTTYKYFGSYIAWKNKISLQAWLYTFRAEVFTLPNPNAMVVWYWKEKQHAVSPKVFEKIPLPEDTLSNNGDIYRCKRHYDDKKHIVHTFWVWYWDDPDKDWREAIMEQNKIRKEFYELDWHTPENQYAINEIKSGRVTPIDLSFLKRED